MSHESYNNSVINSLFQNHHGFMSPCSSASSTNQLMSPCSAPSTISTLHRQYYSDISNDGRGVSTDKKGVVRHHIKPHHGHGHTRNLSCDRTTLKRHYSMSTDLHSASNSRHQVYKPAVSRAHKSRVVLNVGGRRFVTLHAVNFVTSTRVETRKVERIRLFL